MGEGHLRRVLSAYVAYYNQARPHQGLEQRTPLASTEPAGQGPIRRRERLVQRSQVSVGFVRMAGGGCRCRSRGQAPTLASGGQQPQIARKERLR
ncbi:MAG TPA: integrase core domain-containing protein [Chloroflexota bacterium]|nr:integrase core domain-containing protein [Chloroflexota bacterium]